MRKKMCFTVFVFGEDYQSFIPIYLYSIFSVYDKKDYEVNFFLESSLKDNISEELKYLKEISSYKIYENYFSFFEKKLVSSQVKKSIRWLIYEEDFTRFNSVYMGDIDIFICTEETGIYEQHIQHSKILNLPYSNVIREQDIKREITLQIILLSLSNGGIRGLFNEVFTPVKKIRKLTGLHFMITKPYFESIIKTQDDYMEKLKNKNKRFTKFKHHSFGLHNEELLYDLLIDSGIGLPKATAKKIAVGGVSENDISFRPHHGLHLGIFRSEDLIKSKAKDLLSPSYLKYYEEFCYKRENDYMLKRIINNSSSYLSRLLKNMDEFYKENS